MHALYPGLTVDKVTCPDSINGSSVLLASGCLDVY